MPISGKQSVGSTANLFQGYWSQVTFQNGGLVAANTVERYLGVVQEGSLEISREDAEYMGTTFPRVMELISPAQVGMSFSGQMDELHHRNLQIAAGLEPKNERTTVASDADQDGDLDARDHTMAQEDGDYIFPGASCATGNAFGTLRCARERCDGFVMEAVMWKALSTGALTLGGDANVIGTPLEFTAFDDSNGDFHDTSNADLTGDNYKTKKWGNKAPLGFLYAPLAAFGSRDV
tara:strand:- start:2044 stop:2748 length:705 start_codon:yes stop_codon:yes gene_type:complete